MRLTLLGPERSADEHCCRVKDLAGESFTRQQREGAGPEGPPDGTRPGWFPGGGRFVPVSPALGVGGARRAFGCLAWSAAHPSRAERSTAAATAIPGDRGWPRRWAAIIGAWMLLRQKG
jgi:hypothetical protein